MVRIKPRAWGLVLPQWRTRCFPECKDVFEPFGKLFGLGILFVDVDWRFYFFARVSNVRLGICNRNAAILATYLSCLSEVDCPSTNGLALTSFRSLQRPWDSESKCLPSLRLSLLDRYTSFIVDCMYLPSLEHIQHPLESVSSLSFLHVAHVGGLRGVLVNDKLGWGKGYWGEGCCRVTFDVEWDGFTAITSCPQWPAGFHMDGRLSSSRDLLVRGLKCLVSVGVVGKAWISSVRDTSNSCIVVRHP